MDKAAVENVLEAEEMTGSVTSLLGSGSKILISDALTTDEAEFDSDNEISSKNCGCDIPWNNPVAITGFPSSTTLQSVSYFRTIYNNYHQGDMHHVCHTAEGTILDWFEQPTAFDDELIVALSQEGTVIAGWQTLLQALGVEDEEIKAAEQDNQGDIKERLLTCLTALKNKHGVEKTTYDVIKALWDCGITSLQGYPSTIGKLTLHGAMFVPGDFNDQLHPDSNRYLNTIAISRSKDEIEIFVEGENLNYREPVDKVYMAEMGRKVCIIYNNPKQNGTTLRDRHCLNTMNGPITDRVDRRKRRSFNSQHSREDMRIKSGSVGQLPNVSRHPRGSHRSSCPHYYQSQYDVRRDFQGNKLFGGSSILHHSRDRKYSVDGKREFQQTQNTFETAFPVDSQLYRTIKWCNGAVFDDIHHDYNVGVSESDVGLQTIITLSGKDDWHVYAAKSAFLNLYDKTSHAINTYEFDFESLNVSRNKLLKIVDDVQATYKNVLTSVENNLIKFAATDVDLENVKQSFWASVKRAVEEESQSDVHSCWDSYNAVNGNRLHCLLFRKRDSDVCVLVLEADISKIRADVIVNVTDEQLDHVTGTAHDISEAAGPDLISDCKKYIESNGVLKSGDVFQSGPGNLYCRYVLHALAPEMTSHDYVTYYQSFLDVYQRSLDMVNSDARIQSIAVPAFNSGTNNTSVTKAASHALSRAVINYCDSHFDHLCKLETIIVTVDSSEWISIFDDIFMLETVNGKFKREFAALRIN